MPISQTGFYWTFSLCVFQCSLIAYVDHSYWHWLSCLYQLAICWSSWLWPHASLSFILSPISMSRSSSSKFNFRMRLLNSLLFPFPLTAQFLLGFHPPWLQPRCFPHRPSSSSTQDAVLWLWFTKPLSQWQLQSSFISSHAYTFVPRHLSFTNSTHWTVFI